VLRLTPVRIYPQTELRGAVPCRDGEEGGYLTAEGIREAACRSSRCWFRGAQGGLE
jgi:hypothetical protein